MTLFLIAGHGGKPFDSGAVGGGKNEATLVRQLADRMKALAPNDVEILDPSIDWYATRRINADLKKKVGNNPVVELHMDSGASNARGGHVIIKSGYEPDNYDYRLAEGISRLFSGRSEIIVKRDNLYNVNAAARYGINYRLLEVCFISNDADRNLFINDMDGVARTILNAFGIEGDSDMQLSDTITRPDGHSGTVNDVLGSIDQRIEQLGRTDDPTGRGQDGVNLYERVLWMAAKQDAMKTELNEIKTELETTKTILEEIKKAVTD